MTRRPPHERPTAADLARGGQPAPTIAGKPADVCPYCGAVMFVNGTRQPNETIFRYMKCRNASCGKTFVSKQPPATLVREIVDEEEPSNTGQDCLTVFREVG